MSIRVGVTKKEEESLTTFFQLPSKISSSMASEYGKFIARNMSATYNGHHHCDWEGLHKMVIPLYNLVGKFRSDLKRRLLLTVEMVEAEIVGIDACATFRGMRNCVRVGQANIPRHKE
jgi:hypothetical protein